MEINAEVHHLRLRAYNAFPMVNMATPEKKEQFGGWSKRFWREIRRKLEKEWLDEARKDINESQPPEDDWQDFI